MICPTIKKRAPFHKETLRTAIKKTSYYEKKSRQYEPLTPERLVLRTYCFSVEPGTKFFCDFQAPRPIRFYPGVELGVEGEGVRTEHYHLRYRHTQKPVKSAPRPFIRITHYYPKEIRQVPCAYTIKVAGLSLCLVF